MGEPAPQPATAGADPLRPRGGLTGRTRTAIRHLTGGPAGWRFQYRLPVTLFPADSTLAGNRATIRKWLGPLPIRVAATRARLLVSLCVLVAERIVKSWERGNMSDAKGEIDLLARVVAACNAVIGAAAADPSRALSLAGKVEPVLATLKLVAAETGKGEAGLRSVVDNAPGLTRDALKDLLALSERPVGSAGASIDTVVAGISPPAGAAAAPTGTTEAAHAPSQAPGAHAGTGAMPLFSRVARAYIAMRRAGGAREGELQTLELRLKTFLDLMGDRPVDTYFPSDLQGWVTRMRFWPANVTKRMPGGGRGAPSLDSWNTNDILTANERLTQKPVSRKTMQDGYVANVRTMMRFGMQDYDYRDPFARVTIRYPRDFGLSRPRESIGVDVLNRCFASGVASGMLDEAILPLLLYLTSRRLSLCLYLRGSDIRQKHGVYVAQVPSLVQASDGNWIRVPIKTSDSATYFVLHDLLREIGLVDWMIGRGDTWVFNLAHRYTDPSKSMSQLLNRRLRAAGAIGGSIETVHSLRGDAIDVLREDEIKGRAARLQSGHALNDLHDTYGKRALNRADSWSIATRDLPQEIDWSMFRGLDFDALAAGRRSSGPKKKGVS